MPCNCNTASKTCDPCSVCTPPGVTGLTTCKPIDPCEGTKLDISCVQYSGINYPCVGVNNGDNLIDILLKILELYIPESKCCELAGTAVVTGCGLVGTINYYIAPTTTTTSTSTTTTTTIAPSCSYAQMTNVATQPSVVSYVPCNGNTYVQITITDNALVCSSNAYPINVISGAVSEEVLSSCNTPAPPTTTSTTTSAPCTCDIYSVTNSTLFNITITFTQCGTPNFQTTLSIRSDETMEVCSCSDILDNILDGRGVIITNTNVSCTGALTTSTTSTTTTTCAAIGVPFEVIRYESYHDYCNNINPIVTIIYTTGNFIPIVPINYYFAYADVCLTTSAELLNTSVVYVYLGIPYEVFTNDFVGITYTTIGDPLPLCGTTTTTNPPCLSYLIENNTGESVNVSYCDCDTNEELVITAEDGVPQTVCSSCEPTSPDPLVTITLQGICATTTTSTTSTTSTSTTTTAAPTTTSTTTLPPCTVYTISENGEEGSPFTYDYTNCEGVYITYSGVVGDEHLPITDCIQTGTVIGSGSCIVGPPDGACTVTSTTTFPCQLVQFTNSTESSTEIGWVPCGSTEYLGATLSAGQSLVYCVNPAYSLNLNDATSEVLSGCS